MINSEAENTIENPPFLRQHAGKLEELTKEFVSRTFSKENIVGTTGKNVATWPLSIAADVFCIGMSVSTSFYSKIIQIGTSYPGGSPGADMGRDRSRKFFGITDESPVLQRVSHDATYWGLFTAVTSPIGYMIGYLISGHRIDVKEMLAASALQGVVSVINGFQMWWGNDISLYLAGMRQECNRKLPESVKNLKPRAKRGILALATATSLALCAADYGVAMYEHSKGRLHYNNEIIQTEQITSLPKNYQNTQIYFTEPIDSKEKIYRVSSKKKS